MNGTKNASGNNLKFDNHLKICYNILVEEEKKGKTIKMNEKLKEIVSRYNLTSKEISDSIDKLNLGNVCSTRCMVAFAEILVELEYTAIRMEKENEL